MKKLIALTLALLMLAMPALAEQIPAAKDATLTVTGNASVSLKADHAQASVGVSTKAATMEDATAKNAVAIRSVIAALKEAGIAEADIATSNYSVYTEYDYSTGTAKQVGFNVSNQLTVIIRDMENIGAILDKATAAGANSINSISFHSTQSAAAQDEALTYAVQDALRKARLLAAAAGASVGSLISIEENSSVHYTVATTFKSASMRDSVSNVILPDEMTVSASVTIVCELTN